MTPKALADWNIGGKAKGFRPVFDYVGPSSGFIVFGASWDKFGLLTSPFRKRQILKTKIPLQHSIWMTTCISIYIYTHMYRLYTYVYTHTYMCMHIHTHMYVCVRTRMCIYVLCFVCCHKFVCVFFIVLVSRTYAHVYTNTLRFLTTELSCFLYADLAIFVCNCTSDVHMYIHIHVFYSYIIHTYMHTYMLIYIHIQTYIHTLHTYIYMQKYIHTCINTRMQLHSYSQLHGCEKIHGTLKHRRHVAGSLGPRWLAAAVDRGREPRLEVW